MGISINARAYNVADVIGQIEQHVAKFNGRTDVDVDDFFYKVAPHFGAVVGDVFVIVCNEYYDEYCPEWEFYDAVDDYFRTNARETYDGLWLNGGTYVTGGANAAEVLDEVFGDGTYRGLTDEDE